MILNILIIMMIVVLLLFFITGLWVIYLKLKLDIKDKIYKQEILSLQKYIQSIQRESNMEEQVIGPFVSMN